jgi:hypothetical protein
MWTVLNERHVAGIKEFWVIVICISFHVPVCRIKSILSPIFTFCRAFVIQECQAELYCMQILTRALSRMLGKAGFTEQLK